jgi:hypothetical protein
MDEIRPETAFFLVLQFTDKTVYSADQEIDKKQPHGGEEKNTGKKLVEVRTNDKGGNPFGIGVVIETNLFPLGDEGGQYGSTCQIEQENDCESDRLQESEYALHRDSSVRLIMPYLG